MKPVWSTQLPASRGGLIVADGRPIVAAQGWTPYHHPKCGNTFYCVPPSIQYRQSHSRNAHTCMKLRSAATPLAGGDGGDIGGGSGKGTGGGGGGSQPGDGAHDGDDEEEFLSPDQAEAIAGAKGISLPSDFLDIAANGGLRKSVLLNYITLQGTGLAAWFAAQSTLIRDRLLADPNYLFKCIVEVIIDSGCATVAEVRKRGDDFWREFEFYLSDLIVGLVLDVALVTLITPVAVLGKGGVRKGGRPPNALQRYLSTIPTAMFEASIPGMPKYTTAARAACYVVKGLEYSLSGMAAAFVGQGVANALMVARRKMQGGSKEDDVEVPDLLKTTLVWGLFMGVSSNTRYQIVFGLERLFDSTIGRSRPLISKYTTVGIRFINNVIGGENFIDIARWAGVQ